MKTATITFHWAVNYGAVLQAWALQKHLEAAGFDTEIIDYRPRAVTLKQNLRALKKLDRGHFRQARNLEAFRREHLQLTERRFASSGALAKAAPAYGAIIAGSDQIWNESFTLRGEGRKTLSYFLSFAPEETRRVGYAVSFGFHQPTEAYAAAVRDELRRFSAVSVREADGLDILRALGCEGEVVCDPTALVRRGEYEKLIAPAELKKRKVFPYILRGNAQAWQAARCAGELVGQEIRPERFTGTMGEWLGAIAGAELVVTNSFHGTMLSVILGRPFIALTTAGSGMNSRLTTLAEHLGLADRVLEGFDRERVEALARQEIDWEKVEERLEALRSTGADFLARALAGLA